MHQFVDVMFREECEYNYLSDQVVQYILELILDQK